MKFKKLMLIGLLLMAILTIGAASATDDVNATDDALQQDDSQSLPIEDSQDSDKLEASDEDCLSNPSVDLEEGNTFEIGKENENDIGINLDEDFQGYVSVSLNGNSVKLAMHDDGEGEIIYYIGDNAGYDSGYIDDDDEYSLCIDRLAPGRYLLEIVITDLSYHPVLYKAANITVKQKGVETEIGLELADDDQYIQGQAGNIINITAPAGIIHNLKITINDADYSSSFKIISATKGYLDISQLNSGFYRMVVSGGGLSENTTFEVKTDTEHPPEGSIAYPNLDKFYSGSQKSIFLVLPKNATGELLIKDEDEVVYFEEYLENGYASFSLADLPVNDYVLKASYTGYDYDVNEVTISFSVLPKISMPSRMTVGEKKYITVDFVNNVYGTVKFYVDYAEYDEVYIENRNRASFSLVNIDDGEFDLAIEFIGDDGAYFYSDDLPNYYNCHIEIMEVRPRYVGGSNIVMNYAEGKVYKFTVYGRNGKLAEEDEYVEITIGREVYEASTNSRGVVIFKIPDSVTPGKYKIVVNYDDEIQARHALVVKRILKLSKVNVRASGKKLVIKATLKKGMNKKKIIFKFNGKKYSAKTNRKGVAKVVINENVLKRLKVGKRIRYQATYLKDTVKKSVKVGK